MVLINVVWYGVDSRLYKNCTVMLNEMLDSYDCVHHTGGIPPGVRGAVVVVHGESCMDKVTRLSIEIKQLDWVVLVYLGDECQSFPIERIRHANMSLWVQDADPARAPLINRYLPGGYSPGTAHVDVPRDLDWFFAGQITHPHRQACVDAIATIPGGGFSVQTKGYTQGISSAEYFRCLSRAKFVPCPSGPVSPDSTRVWESLECGAVPILDASSPAGRFGLWNLMIPGHPFPVVNDWSALPGLLLELLQNGEFDSLAATSAAFWADYKAKFLLWLKEDIDELSK